MYILLGLPLVPLLLVGASLVLRSLGALLRLEVYISTGGPGMDMGNRNRPSFAWVVPHNKISGQLPYPWQQQQRYGQVLWVLVIMQCWIMDARLWTLTKGFSLSLLRAGRSASFPHLIPSRLALT
ncbi:hypothetical protein EDB87DRAFT_1580218 [Lactarius vividus]|nr:hypothetical protein EDB87DRAFT_1580218 [Lactarius vividus]